MRIVDIQLESLKKRLAERHITLELTAAARRQLVESGYDPNYGARPLKRAIQKELETPLARRILAGEVREGQTIQVDNDGSGQLTFKNPAAVPANQRSKTEPRP
jgi:ATP-dependent Clp protease ATP-binding subunit ClpB